MGSSPHTVTLPGQVWGLVAPTATGPLFSTSYDGANLRTTVVSALDLSGALLWHREFDGHPLLPRATDTGTVWIAHYGPSGPMLTELARDGSMVREFTPEHAPDEHIGVFVVLADGICVAWLSRQPSLLSPRAGHATRIARYDASGQCLWSTPVRLDQVSYPGVVEMSADNGWQAQPKRPWTPASIKVSHWNPLLISGDRIAATFADERSGIGVTSFLDTNTGRLVAATSPGPGGHNAIVAPGEFLIGEQGYGAFRTTRYNRSGTAVQQWASHGLLLVDQHGSIRGPEYENVLPSRSQFRGLAEDGTLRDGPALSGYYTTYPALDSNGTAIFWRDGRLVTVDADFQMSELFTQADERAVMSRVLLLADGQVVFALHSEMLIFRNTGLGPLDDGVWPCGESNLHGNPVAYQ